MDQSIWGNYSSCCRLCLDDEMGSLRSIFEDAIRASELVEQIVTYIGIEVKAGDKLSTMICERCLTKVHSWNTFKKSCFDNQNKLIEWMNSWEANNMSAEILIKQEPMDQSFETSPMDEDAFDEPPLLSPHMPENVFVTAPEEDPLVENEINENELSTAVLESKSTLCSFCDKQFSNVHNRRRHETTVHKRKPVPVDKDPLATLSNNGTNEADVQKIEFAAGLQLKRRDAQSNDSFTNVEIAYLEKYKNIIGMMNTLICVCHNEKFKELKDLFLHLKNLRSWFAMFTCYNCLITYCDRGSYLRHYCSCAKELLFNSKRLSEFQKNSEIKIRIYQNFKCLKCNLIFAFYDDFCSHLDEDHREVDQDTSPYTCLCLQEFDDTEEFKQHINVSCFTTYYCDACFTSHATIDEFKKHCEIEHDQMDGSSLELYDYYHKSKVLVGKSDFGKIDTGERRISTRRQTLMSSFPQPEVKLLEEQKKTTPKSSKVINPHAFSNRKASRSATCPDCDKKYSSYHNMLRHYTLAHDETGLILSCEQCSEKFRLTSELREHEITVHEKSDSEDEEMISDLPKFSCPDCKEMFNTSEEWKKHIESHPKQSCEECGKQFNLQSDLEQHKNVHLNIKVYRDSKTRNYTSSPLLSCSPCKITFDTKEELLQHKMLHEKMPELSIEGGVLDQKDISKKVICTYCNKHYLNYTVMCDHIKNEHPGKEILKEFPKQCPHCDKVLLTRGAYGNHQRMHDRLMGIIRVKPEDDKKVAKAPPGDLESYYTCKRCFKVFSSKSSLKSHMKCHGKNIIGNRSSMKTGKVLKTYWCDICHQACIGYAELQEHKQEHRQVKEKSADIVSEPDLPPQTNPFIFVCDVCNSSFSTSFALTRHREKHDEDSGNKPNNVAVYCKYCKIPFSSAAQWNEHMLSEHDESTTEEKESKLVAKTYACKICGKVFNNAGALASHQGWHKRGNMARNIFSDATPIKLSELKTHQCTSCALQFVNQTALQIHILEVHRNITRVVQLNCSDCHMSFESKSAYETHMQFHKVVEKQNSLSQKPFVCKYCPAKFGRKDRLRGHLKLHHGECEEAIDIFKCTLCDRTFDKQTSLIIHLKVHERHKLLSGVKEIPEGTPKSPSTKKLYFCSICDLGFAIAKDLRTHVITAHPF